MGEYYYPLANEVAKGYSNATVRPSVFPSVHHILVNTLGSTSFHEINRKSDSQYLQIGQFDVNLHLKNIWLNKNIDIKFSNYNVLRE
jgi:hypothetical protein